MEPHSKRSKEVSSAAHQRQPTIRTPRPVSNNWVNKTCDAKTVNKIADETSTADHCARCYGRASVRKGKLEDPHREKCHACGFVGRRRILQKEPVIADETIAVTEHECEANGVEENAAEACVDDALDQHVYGFTRATKASLEHGEADLHPEHQEGSYQRPHCVHRIHDIGRFYLRRATLRMHAGEEHARDHKHE